MGTHIGGGREVAPRAGEVFFLIGYVAQQIVDIRILRSQFVCRIQALSRFLEIRGLESRNGMLERSARFSGNRLIGYIEVHGGGIMMQDDVDPRRNERVTGLDFLALAQISDRAYFDFVLAEKQT